MDEKQEHAKTAEPEKIDLYNLIDQYWKVFRRLWWIVLLLAVLGAAGGYVYAVRTYRPYYEAYTTFTISRRTSYGYTASYYSGTASADQMAKTFPYIISSEALKRQIADDLGMETVPAEISASSVEDTNLFTIRVRAGDPQLAYDVLQSVIANYPNVAQYIIGETMLNYLEESGVPEKPGNSSGARGRLVKMGAAGLLAGLLIVLYFTLNRNTISKEEDFSSHLNVRCLGTVPTVAFKKRNKRSPQALNLLNSRVSSSYQDAIRLVRTRLVRELLDRDAKTFLVTSAVPQEGKSTVAVNLAISLSQMGANVILVDCDLRNPSVEKVLGSSAGGMGFLNVLTGQCGLEEAIHPLKEAGIRVLPQGENAERKRSLLHGKQFAAMIRQLSGLADYVVVDTPPVGVLADTLILSGCISEALFVVKQDYAKVSDILDGLRSLKGSGVHLLGCVLNHTEGGITGHYGYYGRYSRYGYKRYEYGESGGRRSHHRTERQPLRDDSTEDRTGTRA